MPAGTKTWPSAEIRHLPESRKRQFPRERQSTLDPRAAAREERAQELADLLLNDTSPLALRPTNDAAILSLCRASLDASEAMAAKGTKNKDTLAWQRWVAYCAEMDTPAFRSDVLANADLSVVGSHREAIYIAHRVLAVQFGYYSG